MPLVKQKSAQLGRALLEAEDIFNRLLKMFGDEERQLQRGDVVAFFHRADGLAACPDRLGESFLGDICLFAQLAKTAVDSVAHARSMPCLGKVVKSS